MKYLSYGWSVFFKAAIFPFIILHTLVAPAQGDYCMKGNKQARKYYEEAVRYGFKGDKSYFLLRKAIQEDEEFAEAYVRLGEINQDKYRSSNEYRGKDSKSTVNFENRMVDYFNSALEYCPDIEEHKLLYLLGEHFDNRF